MIKEMTVLYVEDDELTRLYFSRTLKKHCKTMHEAADGLTGYQMYQEIRPDLIITDLTLPEMSGYMMIEKIREINPEQRIVITSGSYDRKDYGEKCIWLTKPVSISSLLSQAEKLFS